MYALAMSNKEKRTLCAMKVIRVYEKLKVMCESWDRKTYHGKLLGLRNCFEPINKLGERSR